MNRRSLLAFIGLAPVVAVGPGAAMATTPNAQRALLGLSPIGSVALDARRFHLREVLTVQIDEGEIARKVRAELARHGLFGHYDQLGFIEGGGI